MFFIENITIVDKKIVFFDEMKNILSGNLYLINNMKFGIIVFCLRFRTAWISTIYPTYY